MTPDAAGRPEMPERVWLNLNEVPWVSSEETPTYRLATRLPMPGSPCYVPESEVTRLRAEVEALREVLERVVDDVSRFTDDLLRRAGGHGIPHDYMLGQTMAAARALLAARKEEG